MPIRNITTKAELKALTAVRGGNLVVGDVIAVHFEFVADNVVAAAVCDTSSASNTVALKMNVKKIQQAIKKLLEDPTTVKIMFDVGRIAKWLQNSNRMKQIAIRPVNCVDLQLLISSSPSASLCEIGSRFCGPEVSALVQQVKVWNTTRMDWQQLETPQLRKLTATAKLLAKCYLAAGSALQNSTVSGATAALWRNGIPIGPTVSTTTPPLGRTTFSQDIGRTSSREITDITTGSDLQRLLARNGNIPVEGNPPVAGVHFQFTRQNDKDQLVAICVVGQNPLDSAVVLHVNSLPRSLVLLALKTLLEDPRTVKVMHDIYRVAYWLHCYGLTNSRMVKCVDLQLVYENVVDPGQLQASLLEIVKSCESSGSSISVAGTMASFQTKTKPVSPAEWTLKPLPEPLLERLAIEANLYARCYDAVDKKFASSAACHAMTAARWQHAVINRGVRAIWFNPDADNQPRSLECFDYNNSGIPGMLALPSGISSLELQCDLDPVLDLLPVEYSDAIAAIDDFDTKLVDVCLDVGRIPYVYIGKKQRVVISESNAPVTKETIDEVIANLGGEMRIGSDNRAGLDRQLHRISVMRDKTDEVYGLTMRVGRALLNSACVLTDLLLSDKHAGKSVLFLGKPGSGKTTLIRDVARCVSETMENVCIIDTSNEIGGDGLVPHSCVGWARRMMVPSLEAQASVMVECVQNHTVETLIVDEIGRKAEVLAASTVRQRGPRLIASAHGDFRSLIKNPDLKGLVGGSQQVILGDGAAARSALKSKLQSQRAGNPIFDVIVELDHEVRGRCRIIWDVVQEVDNVLNGEGFNFEMRERVGSSCGVQVRTA